ncbi:MAG: ABC transporter substrate-binding protein [Gemmatimonadaceae bacterium]
MRRIATAIAALAVAGCGDAERNSGRTIITLSSSVVGTDGPLLRTQLDRFMRLHPDIEVRLHRVSDDATQRHQLFVQWLNAHAGDPDVLELDVVWTSEFAAAGWLLPLTDASIDTAAFFPGTLAACRWGGQLYALPWYADVGLLYRRTDLVPREPQSIDELVRFARAGMRGPGAPPFGIAWMGARYEGLITVFVEYLGAFGGRIMDDSMRVTVDAPEAVRALTSMRDQITESRIAPNDVLTWHEEETRFAFQNGRAVFMRNWPYAYTAMADSSESRVAGKYAVSPMPAAPGGRPTAALGGAQLGINRWTEHPEAALALVAFITAPEQQLERAVTIGEFPTRIAVYDDSTLRAALPIPAGDARRAVESATPRPVTPLYTQLSEILQIELHRALAGQITPEAALRAASQKMNTAIERTGLRDYMFGSRVTSSR